MPRLIKRKALFRSVVILAATAATSTPADVGQDKTEIARLLALGGERFSIHRTDHFLIASDGNADAVIPVADRLEATYQAVVRFCADITLPIHPPLQPLPVLLFDRHSEFEHYANTVGLNRSAVPGFYHLRNNTAAFCNLLDLPEVRKISQQIEQAEVRRDSSLAPERIHEWRSQRDTLVETFNRLVIQHEAAHQVLFNIGVLSREADNPDWLVEGLACQFEATSPDSVNQMRLADFRDALGAAPDTVEITEAAFIAAQSDGRFFSLVDLIADDKFNSAEVNTRTSRYAQAWALVGYLRRKHGDTLAPYLQRTAANPPNGHIDRARRIAEFESMFGQPDQAFERLWTDSILKLHFNPPKAGR